MITSGANQAFVNVVLALVDASDRVVLFSPYYFNHLMALQVRSKLLYVWLILSLVSAHLLIQEVHIRALQMTGGADSVVFGPCHSHTLHPDLDWLEQEMKGPSPPKMVVLISPCNPTGESLCCCTGVPDLMTACCSCIVSALALMQAFC